MTFSQFLFAFSPFVSVTVHGNSMIPTIKNREKLLVMKYFLTRPHVGDIVVSKHPLTDKVIIKRLIKMNKHNVWIEGDNAHESTDSRSFGWMSKDNIIGKVLVK